MLTLGPGSRVMLASAPIDLRKGHDGLVSLVRAAYDADPYDGTIFVFVGRRADRIKLLFFDSGGFVVYYKRLERGRFRLPAVQSGATQVRLDATALAMLLDGIDLDRVRRPTHWAPRGTRAAA